MSREHEDVSPKFGRVEIALVNLWRSMGRDSIETGKYLAHSDTVASPLKNVMLLLS